MKKIIGLILFVLVSVSVFSDGILTLDGDEWTAMTMDQKQYFIAGILLGFEVVRTAAAENRIESDIVLDEEGKTADDYLIEFAEYFYLDKNIQYFVSYLDKFYRNPSNRQYTVWSNVMIACDKDWW